MNRSIPLAILLFTVSLIAEAQEKQQISVDKADAVLVTQQITVIDGNAAEPVVVSEVPISAMRITTDSPNSRARASKLVKIDGVEFSTWPRIDIPPTSPGVFILTQPGIWGVEIDSFKDGVWLPTESVRVVVDGDETEKPPVDGNKYAEIQQWLSDQQITDILTANAWSRCLEQLELTDMQMEDAKKAVQKCRRDVFTQFGSDFAQDWNELLMELDRKIADVGPPENVSEYQQLVTAISGGLKR